MGCFAYWACPPDFGGQKSSTRQDLAGIPMTEQLCRLAQLPQLGGHEIINDVRSVTFGVLQTRSQYFSNRSAHSCLSSRFHSRTQVL